MAEEFKIESHIPMPSTGTKYPFSKMEVGDSILGDDKLRTASHTWGVNHNVKFVTRKTDDGVRVWRVK